MAFSPLLTELIDALRCLPGVGPRSAQRMALHLLERNRQGGEHLAETLERALALIQHCKHCRTFCEMERCLLCNDNSRDAGLLCVVETPADILAIEHTSSFRGYYFVLMGRLSPLDGIGPEELGLPELIKRLDSEPLREVILATNPTVEGEVTAHYISNLVRARGIKATRIAHGVPLGGELEYVDGGTLAHALAGRIAIED